MRLTPRLRGSAQWWVWVQTREQEESVSLVFERDLTKRFLPLLPSRHPPPPQSVSAQSDSEAVREFTAGAGQPTPNQPVPMTEAEVDFIGKMILDEVMELFATLYDPATAKAKLSGFIKDSKDLPKEDFSKLDAKTADLHKAAAQADALVDVYYYSQNAACKWVSREGAPSYL